MSIFNNNIFILRMDDRFYFPHIIEDYENELEEELSKTFKEKGHSKFLSEGARFLKKIDQNINKNCANEIKNFRKYFYIDPKRDFKVYPIGDLKEESVENVYRELERCTERYDIVINDIHEILQFATEFYELQFRTCRFNCLRVLNVRKMPEIKTCLRRCHFFTNAYMDIAIEDALMVILGDKFNFIENASKL